MKMYPLNFLKKKKCLASFPKKSRFSLHRRQVVLFGNRIISYTYNFQGVFFSYVRFLFFNFEKYLFCVPYSRMCEEGFPKRIFSIQQTPRAGDNTNEMDLSSVVSYATCFSIYFLFIYLVFPNRIRPKRIRHWSLVVVYREYTANAVTRL